MLVAITSVVSRVMSLESSSIKKKKKFVLSLSGVVVVMNLVQ